MSGNFIFGGRHCGFTLLNAGYFYIPIDILDIYFGLQVSYLEAV